MGLGAGLGERVDRIGGVLAPFGVFLYQGLFLAQKQIGPRTLLYKENTMS